MDTMAIGEKSRSMKTKRKRRLPDEETVFNYMTGMYEKVKKSKTLDTENTSTISPIEDTEIDVIDVYGSANNTSTTLDSSQNEERMRYKCYDCIYETLDISGLEEHSTEHPDSNFKCSEHEQLQENCLRCIYQKCLSTLDYPSETPTIHVDIGSEESIVKSLIVNNNQCHYKNRMSKSEHKKLKCSTCCFETISPNYLRKHVCFQNNRKQERITNSTTSSKCGEDVDSECSDIEVTAEYILDPSSNQHSTRRIRTRAVDGFMCLHCSFIANSRDLLKSHALEHYNQEFKCSEHLDTKDDQCNSCKYELILKELEKEVLFHCQGCDFKTLKEETLLKHQREKDHYRNSVEIEGTSVIADLKCFDCDFKTWREDYLRSHASKHKFSQFECPEHSEVIDDCIKCIYKRCLLYVSQESDQGGLESSISNECISMVGLVEKSETETSVELRSDEETKEKPADVSSSTSAVDTRVTNDNEDCMPEDYRNSSSIGSAPPNNNRQGESESQDESMETPNTSQPQLKDEDHVPDIDSKDAIDIVLNELDSENGPQITSNLELKYKCFQCNFMTNERRQLRTHARRHDGGFKCVEHYGMKATCLKCIYQDCASSENDQTTLEFEDNKDYKCFDCEYKTNYLGDFRRHTWIHRGSKYSCPDHQFHSKMCDRCYYEKCLKEVPLKRRKCGSCGYAAFRSDNFARHNCSAKSQSSHKKQKYYKCRDCGYRTIQKNDFRRHASRHKDSKYSCPYHRVLDVKCSMCFYGKCVESLSMFICDDCDFTTYRKRYLDLHRKRRHSEGCSNV